MITNTPKLRSARIWHSLCYTMRIAHDAGQQVAAAYVDRQGKTQLLWRDTDAPLGALALAEAGAWTAIVENDPTQSLLELLQARLVSNQIFNLTEDHSRIRMAPVQGGQPLIVDSFLIGSVCIVGDDSVSKDLSKTAALAYMASYFDDTDAKLHLPPHVGVHQADHYGITVIGDLPIDNDCGCSKAYQRA